MDLDNIDKVIEITRRYMDALANEINEINAMTGYLMFNERPSHNIPDQIARALHTFNAIPAYLVEVQAAIDALSHQRNNLPSFIGKPKAIERIALTIQEKSFTYKEKNRSLQMSIQEIRDQIVSDCHLAKSIFSQVESALLKYGDITDKYRGRLGNIVQRFAEVHITEDPTISELKKNIALLDQILQSNPLEVRPDIENILAASEQKALAKLTNLKNEASTRQDQLNALLSRHAPLQQALSSFKALITTFNATFAAQTSLEIDQTISSLQNELSLANASLSSGDLCAFDMRRVRVEQYQDIISRHIRERSPHLRQEIKALDDLKARWGKANESFALHQSAGKIRKVGALSKFSERIEALLSEKVQSISDIDYYVCAFETKLQEEIIDRIDKT